MKKIADCMKEACNEFPENELLQTTESFLREAQYDLDSVSVVMSTLDHLKKKMLNRQASNKESLVQMMMHYIYLIKHTSQLCIGNLDVAPAMEFDKLYLPIKEKLLKIKYFFENIKVGDILILILRGIKNKFLVLNVVNILGQEDRLIDLDIPAILPIFDNGVYNNEKLSKYYKAAVTGMGSNIIVTLNPNFTVDNQYLGEYPEQRIPSTLRYRSSWTVSRQLETTNYLAQEDNDFEKDRSNKDLNEICSLKEVMQTSDMLVEIAKTYLLSKDPDNALKSCERACEVWNKNAKAYAFRGQLFLIKLDYKRAFADFDQALFIDPALKEAKDGIASLFLIKAKRELRKKMYDKSKKSVKEVLKWKESNEAYSMLKHINAKLGYSKK